MGTQQEIPERFGVPTPFTTPFYRSTGIGRQKKRSGALLYWVAASNTFRIRWYKTGYVRYNSCRRPLRGCTLKLRSKNDAGPGHPALLVRVMSVAPSVR